MSSQSLRPEQLAALEHATELINEALYRIKQEDKRTAVLLLRDAREILDTLRASGVSGAI